MLSTPIKDIPFTAIDFESAGVERGQTDVPIQVGMASLQDGKISDLYRSYIATDRPVTWAASKVHGITTESLQGAPEMNTLWPDFRRMLRDRAVVAHGAGTEKRFLRAFPMHGFAPWIDTLNLSRACFPSQAKHNLHTACKAAGVEEQIKEICSEYPEISWHDALFDAVASLALLQAIIAATEIGDQPLENLISPDLQEYYRARE